MALPPSEIPYDEEVAAIRRQVERLCFDETRWELCKQTKDGSKVSRLECADSKGHVFKTECLVQSAPEELSNRIHPCGPYRTQWDSMLRSAQLIETVNENTLIIRHVTKSQMMGLISGRDSIDLACFEIFGDRRQVVLSSIDYPKIPPVSGLVRSWSYPTGLFLYPTANPCETRVVGIFHAEMHLSLVPHSLVDAFVPGCCLQFLSDLQRSPQLPKAAHGSLPGWT